MSKKQEKSVMEECLKDLFLNCSKEFIATTVSCML